MADSVGSGFPTKNIQVGHIFHDLDVDTLYQYEGGDATDPNNWTAIHTDAKPGVGGGISGVIILDSSVNIGTFTSINFIPGTNVTLSITDAGGGEVNVTINSSGGGAASIDPASVTWTEDFVSGLATTGQIGAMGWSVLLDAGATHTLMSQFQTRPGVLLLENGNTAGDAAELFLDSAGNDVYLGLNFRDCVISALISNINNNTTFRLGLHDSAFGTPSEGCWFESVLADANFFAVCATGAVETRVDTGIPKDSAWHKWRIHSADGATFIFELDGVQVASINTNTPINGISPRFFVTSNANVDDHGLYVDFVGMKFDMDRVTGV